MAKKKGAPSEKALIEFFVAQKQQARDERTELEAYWKRTEAQMLNKADFSKKKDWQAKLFYSMTSPTVNQASRMIKNMLMKSQDFFEMDYVGQEDLPLAKAFKPAIKFYLNDAEFPERFAEAASSGFSYGIGIQKMFCRSHKRTVVVDNAKITKEVMKLHINTLNPWNCYWPKDWAFFIEDTWTTIPELLKKAEAGVYDEVKGDKSGLKKIKKIIGSDYRLEKPGGDAADQESERLRRLGINDDKNTNLYRKPVLLSEYWGPIIDKKGRVTAQNQKFCVINEKFCIQSPILNPFSHQKWPYVFIVPLKVLFRHYGEGLTWGVDPIQGEATNVLNLMSDSLKFQMLGVNQVSEDMLVDRDKPVEIYPGKFIRVKGDPRKSAFEHHPMGTDPDAAAGFLQLLRSIYQNHTGMTEFMQGAPTLKGSPTATEVATKTAAGQGDFQAIAEDIDRQGIVASCEMAKDLVIQYFADLGTYPNITRVFEGETGRIISELTTEEKTELLIGDWDIKARGISLWFERKEQINKLARHNDFLGTVPPDIALQMVDWQAIGEAWSEAVWGDKEKFWKFKEQPEEVPMGQEGAGMESPPVEEESGINEQELPYGMLQ